jgi:hypothetical protein
MCAARPNDCFNVVVFTVFTTFSLDMFWRATALHGLPQVLTFD